MTLTERAPAGCGGAFGEGPFAGCWLRSFRRDRRPHYSTPACASIAPAVDKWTLFLAALGLAVALEGLPYFISPPTVRAYLRTLERAGDGTLRLLGFAMIATGLLLTFFATR